MTKRIEYIDAMRGFTMLLVVMHHIDNWCMGNLDLGYNEFMTNFRMPLFFFISGWVFYKTDRLWDMSSIKNILHKKFVVQIVPFIVFLSLYLYVFNQLSVSSFGSDKFGYWFTFVLFEFFVIYVLTERLLNRKNQEKGEVYVGFVALVLSVTSFYYAKYYVQYAIELGEWKTILGGISFVKFKYFLFFWLGTIAKRFFSDFIKFTDNKYIMVGIVLLFFTITLRPHVDSVLGEFAIYAILGFAGICVVFTFFRTHESFFSKDKIWGRACQFVGRRTLDIYLLHYFFLPYNLEFIGSFLKKGDNRIIDMLFILPLSIWIIAICLIVSEIIRLSPLLAHYLFGLQKDKK